MSFAIENRTTTRPQHRIKYNRAFRSAVTADYNFVDRGRNARGSSICIQRQLRLCRRLCFRRFSIFSHGPSVFSALLCSLSLSPSLSLSLSFSLLLSRSRSLGDTEFLAFNSSQYLYRFVAINCSHILGLGISLGNMRRCSLTFQSLKLSTELNLKI